MSNYISFLFVFVLTQVAFSQHGYIKGRVESKQGILPGASIYILELEIGTLTNKDGEFQISKIPDGEYTLVASYVGHKKFVHRIEVNDKPRKELIIRLENSVELNEVVVSGTLKPIDRLESPVPVEVFQPTFFKKNPTPNMYEALQNINGVRPQLNCNVCGTGDVHINGLEGAYTMVLIDGMPIVSSLSTVYGLSGIPNSMIERMEIVKGPASSLYGSEAIGGLINIITKSPQSSPKFSADVMATTWGELNFDIGATANLGDKVSVLTGVNAFYFNQLQDFNSDNFTDVTLQKRVSVFQKWNFNRPNDYKFYLAGRYLYEDRWGGELNWTPEFRGGDSIYGESIYTSRWEILGLYQLPSTEHLNLSFSLNQHQQNSVYGNMSYVGDQRIAFAQLVWDRSFKKHDLLAGTALRYTYYDDNTAATEAAGEEITNNPDQIWLPGIFIQDQWKLDNSKTVLTGLRYDYNNRHGNIFTPRLAIKWKVSSKQVFRLNAGTGFRIVNLFTEDHAALTGSRDLLITEDLAPEQSYNVNLNYIHKVFLKSGSFITFDASLWYTYFTNMIIPDYETNPQAIIYDNIDGFAYATGASLNAEFFLGNGWSSLIGGSFIWVESIENGQKERPLLTERFTGTWSLSYSFKNVPLSLDYTGNVYGPMKLPLQGSTDPRPLYSTTWSIQNLQGTYKLGEHLECYGGVKNILNWTPDQSTPFLIARSNDPFDKEVEFDADGNPLRTESNPYGLTFDASYVYAPNQGRRFFIGFRYSL